MCLHNKQKLFLKRFSFAGNAVKNSIIVFYDFFYIYAEQSDADKNKAKLSLVVKTLMLLLLLDTGLLLLPPFSITFQHET